MTLRSKLRTLARLSPDERREVVRLVPAVLLVSAGLGRIPLRTLRRLIGLRVEPQPGLGSAAARTLSIRNASMAVDLWARNWPGMSGCLPRALVLGHALRSHGAVVRIGVARDAGKVAAHAWVDVGGISLEGPPVEDAPRAFVPLRHAG